jgi:hypothetical protein
MRKEHANLIPTIKMGIYYVKIGFRILTTFFMKTAFQKTLRLTQTKVKNRQKGIYEYVGHAILNFYLKRAPMPFNMRLKLHFNSITP